MPNTNSWLCIYAIAQLGRPYWYATNGQISSPDVYSSTVKPALQRDGLSLYTNYASQYGQKVHDCSGLVLGALVCTGVDEPPSPSIAPPIAHSANLQYTDYCKTKSNNMSDFPAIPGTLVFPSGGSKHHVGIYVGTYTDKDGHVHHSQVIEARGHNWGIVSTDVGDSKWACWGQLDCCEVDTTTETTFDARINAASGSQQTQVAGPITINTEAMRPFVATVLGEANPNIDYKKIKEARISMMMFFAGQLYDASHRERTYVNPNLAKQIANCNNAGMPYALYVNVRATNHIEADKECKTLYYVISQYPPKLGLWLRLQTTNTKAINDDILELYYRYMEKWGLSNKCGLYVTPEELNKITWDRFKDRYYLWMIDSMDVDDVDDELLDPSMFEVPD